MSGYLPKIGCYADVGLDNTPFLGAYADLAPHNSPVLGCCAYRFSKFPSLKLSMGCDISHICFVASTVSIWNLQPRKLLDQVRDAIRFKHYSYRTEQTHVGWIRRYILFYNKRHPRDMGVTDVEAFFTHLAVEEQVFASTQNQALCALLLLYRIVFNQELGQLDAIRAKRSYYLPTVLTKDEVQSVLQNVSGVAGLVLKVLYGSGLRLSKGLSLRIKDGADLDYWHTRAGKAHDK